MFLVFCVVKNYYNFYYFNIDFYDFFIQSPDYFKYNSQPAHDKKNGTKHQSVWKKDIIVSS